MCTRRGTGIWLWVFAAIVIRAQPQGSVRGRVIDSTTGEPLARVQMTLAGTDRRVISDGSGAFRLAGVDAGEYTLHVSTVGYHLLRQDFKLEPGEAKEFEIVLTPSSNRRTDTVEVKAGPFDLERQDSPAELTLAGNELKNLASVLADDPLRAVQALPGVTSDNDFNAEFSLRGAAFNRIGVYLDGVLLHEPFHMVEGQGQYGSLSVFNGDILEGVTVYEGAWPVRYADRTAGIVSVDTRSGSNAQTSFRASASASNASLFAEGPLGRRKRLTWMASVRKSYFQYLLDRLQTGLPALVFGFTDGQGKLTFEQSPTHTISLSVFEAQSGLDRSSTRAKLGVNSLMLSDYHFTQANLASRFSPAASFLMTSHAAWTRERGSASNPFGASLGRDGYGEWVGRTDASWIWGRSSTLSFGGLVRRLRDDGSSFEFQYRPYYAKEVDLFRGAEVRTGGYAQQSWTLAQGRIELSAGGRYDHSSVSPIGVVSPYASLALVPLAATRIQFAWGQYAQYPELNQFFSVFGNARLLPERATQFDASLEQTLDPKTRVRLEFYDRQDRDLLARPLFDPRVLPTSAIFFAPLSAPIVNSQRGYSRGAQIFVQRRTANGFTGWVSYTYGVAKVTDGVLQLAYPADSDQRHTVNVFGSYRVRPTVNLSVKWLYGSGFPMPGFFRLTPAGYFLAANRNQLRLPPYERLDLRVNKAFVRDKWKATLFAEVINVLDRTNKRFDSFGGYDGTTGQAYPSFLAMFPILPSAGIVFER